MFFTRITFACGTALALMFAQARAETVPPPIPQPASQAQPEAQSAPPVPQPAPVVVASPPAYASKTEAELRASLMEHLKPLLAFKLKAEQLAEATRALKHVLAGKLEEADPAAAKVTVAAAAKLIEWKRLQRGGGVKAADYAAFLRANPLWPDRERLQRLFEDALLRDGGSAKDIKAYLTAFEPVSGDGYAALASAERALGNEAVSKKLAARAWCHERIASRDERDFLVRFDRLLSEADHKCRLDRLLIANPRDRSIRQSRVAAANRLLPKLNASEQEKAKVRIAIFGGASALKELSAIVKDQSLVKDDWGLAFQRIERARKAKDWDHALSLLKAVPGEHEGHINRNAWWDERERHARHWLAKGNAKRAYEIASGVRPEEPNAAKEQAFFSGWLALVRLSDPKAATGHFARMVGLSDGPLSRSMAEFWLAKAHAKAGDEKKARDHYRKSAAIRDTFHGLMSKRAAWPGSRAIELPSAKLPTPEEVTEFLGQDAVNGLLAAYALGLPRRDILAFYRTLGDGLKSEGQMALMAQLASALGDGQGEVRIGKAGVARGFNLYEFSYPVHMLPKYDPLREPVEPALLLGIGRQESEFNTQIISRAGARGVLQVMPITARHICRQYAIKCNLENLLKEPAYNARIASAYIADRRDEFAGSYILTLTGFNAGPGRTRQWLREMGDPRNKDARPLDWIYRIPFEETRLYVRKVLSNLQIYRARLGEKDPLRLDRDLRRGRS